MSHVSVAEWIVWQMAGTGDAEMVGLGRDWRGALSEHAMYYCSSSELRVQENDGKRLGENCDFRIKLIIY